MESLFISCMRSLSELLGMVLEIEDNIANLTIDDKWPVHLSAVTPEQLVIFSPLNQVITGDLAIQLLKDNLFSTTEGYPRIGIGPDDTPVIWCQHSLLNLDASTCYQLLLHLSEKIKQVESLLENDHAKPQKIEHHPPTSDLISSTRIPKMMV